MGTLTYGKQLIWYVCKKLEMNSVHLSKIKSTWGLLKGYRNILYNSKVEYTPGTQSGFGIKEVRDQSYLLHLSKHIYHKCFIGSFP